MSYFSLTLYTLLIFTSSELSSLSFVFLLVVTFVFLAVSTHSRITTNSLSSSLVFFLFLIVVCFLCTYSLLVLFIMYELSLLPVCLLILLIGYQPEKINSMLYLLLYTVVCSVPFFYFSVCHISSLCTGFSTIPQFLSLLVCISFLVKSPMYTLHS